MWKLDRVHEVVREGEKRTLINRVSGKLTPSMKTCGCQHMATHQIDMYRRTIVTELKQLMLLNWMLLQILELSFRSNFLHRPPSHVI